MNCNNLDTICQLQSFELSLGFYDPSSVTASFQQTTIAQSYFSNRTRSVDNGYQYYYNLTSPVLWLSEHEGSVQNRGLFRILPLKNERKPTQLDTPNTK
jgi:hypothetical protein